VAAEIDADCRGGLAGIGIAICPAGGRADGGRPGVSASDRIPDSSDRIMPAGRRGRGSMIMAYTLFDFGLLPALHLQL
jgi:hypothetical protein